MSFLDARQWGWHGVTIFALGAVLAALTTFLLLLPFIGADVTPLSDDITTAPATGVEGYDVELFCNDPLTAVEAFPVPDSTAINWQLVRSRDGVRETVKASLSEEGVRSGVHYFNANVIDTQGNVSVEQQSEPGHVSAGAWECIEKKAGK